STPQRLRFCWRCRCSSGGVMQTLVIRCHGLDVISSQLLGNCTHQAQRSCFTLPLVPSINLALHIVSSEVSDGWKVLANAHSTWAMTLSTGRNTIRPTSTLDQPGSIVVVLAGQSPTHTLDRQLQAGVISRHISALLLI